MKKALGITFAAGILAVGLSTQPVTAAAKAAKYEVVDVACYVAKGAHGEKHKECAVKCVSGGGELALLKGGKLYIPVDASFHSARAQFASKAGEMVEVTGKVVSKGGSTTSRSVERKRKTRCKFVFTS